MTLNFRFLVAVIGLAIMPAAAHATARLISVVPVNGGCVYGPRGSAVQAWDVEPGETYTLTLANVPACTPEQMNSKRMPVSEGDPTINVRVNSSGSGNFDLAAYYVAPGVYAFDFTIPPGAGCTMPIFYCTVPGDASTGQFVIREDGVGYQAHLRVSQFGPGCTNPQEVIGPACGPVPTENATWGSVKALFR